MKTFDMQFIRYMNLFSRITRVSAKHSFLYNNMIVFVVMPSNVERAIGRDNENLKKISNILGKRIRVVAQPRGIRDISGFLSVIVSPIKYQNLNIVDNETGEKEVVISTQGRENKAMLIGRERIREKELKEIVEQYFGIKNLKIV
jgi:NusA-like KH domain protein